MRSTWGVPMSRGYEARLARLERDRREQQIEAHVARLAAEFGLAADEIWQEAEAVIAYYGEHLRYPRDIEWAINFTDEHGRLPRVDEWPEVVE
jgi:hypothetical protein